MTGILFCSLSLEGQAIHKQYSPKQMSDSEYIQLKTLYGKNKTLPSGFEKQALTALSFYPELQSATILFRILPSQTPLASRPAILSAFRSPFRRTYLITISSETMSVMEPILLKNLPYNAQIGVLGHEIAHISYYCRQNTWQLIALALHYMGKRFTDSFEYNTDKACIDHGLGYQLLDWSLEVRNRIHSLNWRGAENAESIKNQIPGSERYMNPATILDHIHNNPIYSGNAR